LAAVPELDWGSCAAEGEGLEAFQCATAVVPLDYDRPKGRQITLALARLPASDPSRRIGSLFLNPGGPGGSGVDMVLQGGPFLFSDEVRARFDLVGFDPRGIIRSTPLRCYETFDEAIADLPPFQFPVTREEERIKIRSDRALARACAEWGGPILDHMSTANVARDMDLLRRAVGDARLSYAGYSYGSYLGATYANLFPGKVRALVVDGVLDPVAWSTGTPS
jgi:pimeloyl-ACP methyl ester carboxylesterase